jgi:hypothetical protein
MKVQGADFDAVQRGLIDTLKAHDLHPYMVSTVAHMWQVFNRAWTEKRIDGHDLYKRYTDAHLEIAMRKIFKR